MIGVISKRVRLAKLKRASGAASAARLAMEPMEIRRLLAAQLVQDINVDTADAAPAQFAEFGSKVLFEASDGVNGRQLWRTDGTTGGTSVVKVISPNLADLTLMPALADVSLFFAFDSAHGKELWRTDGTEAGTFLLKDINPGTNSSPRPPAFSFQQPPDRAVVINNVLYFQATDGVHGLELWRSDGTVAGTYMVRDINAGSVQSGIAYQVAVGNTLYFSATDGSSTSPQLWRSDGTEAGTVRINAAGSDAIAPRDLTVVGNQVYYIAPVAGGTWQLRRSDGTSAGTTTLASFSAQPSWLAEAGGALLLRRERPGVRRGIVAQRPGQRRHRAREGLSTPPAIPRRRS
jgi:ELWxxDGT repeat protein